MSIFKGIIKLFFLFFIILTILLIYYLSPTGLSSKQIIFTIPLNTEQDTIVHMLRKDNFIHSEKVFNIVSGLTNFPGTVEPGSYLLSHNMNALQITNTLLFHPYQKWIVLVPGLRLDQTAERLAKKFNWDKTHLQDFLKNANEGYMYPDTYLLNVDYTGKEVAQRLISNFNDHLIPQMQKDLLSQNVRIDTAVKIASLIERESGGDSDKALIAGIIWNRLDQNMKLQIDATVQYAIGTPADWWPHVTPQDLTVNSLYNTYIIRKLPPGPIDSPGLSSIKAAIYPAQTDCLFYLHDHNKQIHCAKTYEEHLKNIEEYLQ
ncbi:endolytic transglycosylase MltG [Patescibacteria group bacterium]|nr:endolytic transglycosylase MltG [Patescibacteria group bacterium]